jgi:Na+/H+ antiporter NhaD/arsenite permease-like protein
VGVGCVTDCDGNPDNRTFCLGHSELHENNVIQLIMHLDPSPQFSGKDVNVNIIRLPDNTTVHSTTFGPIHHDERQSFEEKINVDWETDGNVHVIDVMSKSGDKISFTLAALVMNSLAKHSVLIAALIMILVYALILVEIIHRTLVAIFGSMVALFFFFIMHNGGTEGIATIMLHLEWSTLGLLFGMMIIVGELSHTGIFEWFAVRILVFSKGSFSRLIALLSVLTALASAFLDNVTTMLLLAPVTIDMCRIIDVDPRPYLIAEVLLSNVGGTATLIGDPPNIIIGSSFDEIGFVDFIIHILPCIFILCVPVSILLVIWIYKPYLTMKEMKAIDSEKLKRTYPVYDQPRLMIAGTTATFVILLFFLHPVHHKDTAWIALIGAFLTIAFTNPHDVQDALRNHVEWDTLLFFAGLFVLVEVCAAMGLLKAIGDVLANIIKKQEVSQQLPIAITLILWVSAFTSAFLDNIPYTATMIPILRILHSELPDTLPLKTLAWALSFGACLGGNGTLLGASANIVTAGIATNKGYSISFLNFLYPGMLVMIATIAIANLYMAIVYVWI